MASSSTKSVAEHESFRSFFEKWLVEQTKHLEDLVSVSKGRQTTTDDQQALQVVKQVVEHYDAYYTKKARWAKHDILAMLTPSWRSLLEDAFLWIGGWRPSLAFHLLYSKSGLQFGGGFIAFLQGISSDDLGDISASQLRALDELQRKTIKEENELTEDMAKLQETIADSSMVELSHALSELIRNSEAAGQERTGGFNRGELVSTLAEKEAALEEILKDADELRMRTLKGILAILSPMQAVHFLIAAAELHLRLHNWGKQKEAGLLKTQGST